MYQLSVACPHRNKMLDISPPLLAFAREMLRGPEILNLHFQCNNEDAVAFSVFLCSLPRRLDIW